MNMVNGLLRQAGLKGISHGDLDLVSVNDDRRQFRAAVERAGDNSTLLSRPRAATSREKAILPVNLPKVNRRANEGRPSLGIVVNTAVKM